MSCIGGGEESEDRAGDSNKKTGQKSGLGERKGRRLLEIVHIGREKTSEVKF